ncbi:hypothetical protein NYZ99_09205 [Maribacter litopenaei]|uniref:RiboL-PSP-HEPN domain-containing protein n=1 Tax=Maribacter litopenaei TaxID=2976127 RepID=A0ABY5YD53_9FLAO|nr:hypothetical protein [Maribacter litopenaei]UWX56355.1 hypothetical protein NYZ99_09205 [Maribacter litopenaei]
MTNPYKKYLDLFFEKLLYYRHISGRIDKVFRKEIEVYSSDKAIMHFASALVISDWSGPTDNGWELNFHTGIFAETTKENYETEIKNISSRQRCLLYAQSYESFERFLKDCLFDKLERDNEIKEYVISLLPKNQNSIISRKTMPGGDKLFNVLKKVGGKTFKKFSISNNLDVKFKELWTILSEVRHAITHNESTIELNKINKSDHHFAIFNYLFNSKKLSDNELLIDLDFKKFEKLIKRFSEFAFQVFKIISIEEELEWKK